jgi:hypothetical protein
MAALDGRPCPGRERTITLKAKAWLVALACRKAKDSAIPTNCGRRDLRTSCTSMSVSTPMPITQASTGYSPLTVANAALFVLPAQRCVTENMLCQDRLRRSAS